MKKKKKEKKKKKKREGYEFRRDANILLKGLCARWSHRRHDHLYTQILKLIIL